MLAELTQKRSLQGRHLHRSCVRTCQGHPTHLIQLQIEIMGHQARGRHRYDMEGLLPKGTDAQSSGVRSVAHLLYSFSMLVNRRCEKVPNQELDTPRPETPLACRKAPIRSTSPISTCLAQSLKMTKVANKRQLASSADEQLPVLPWGRDGGVLRSHTCTKNG